ncbi:MAG: response regulator [Deltaproteobacteria bacterium]|nr:response regulator [Deltaproteobacteria bacterium]
MKGLYANFTPATTPDPLMTDAQPPIPRGHLRRHVRELTAALLVVALMQVMLGAMLVVRRGGVEQAVRLHGVMLAQLNESLRIAISPGEPGADIDDKEGWSSRHAQVRQALVSRNLAILQRFDSTYAQAVMETDGRGDAGAARRQAHLGYATAIAEVMQSEVQARLPRLRTLLLLILALILLPLVTLALAVWRFYLPISRQILLTDQELEQAKSMLLAKERDAEQLSEVTLAGLAVRQFREQINASRRLQDQLRLEQASRALVEGLVGGQSPEEIEERLVRLCGAIAQRAEMARCSVGLTARATGAGPRVVEWTVEGAPPWQDSLLAGGANQAAMTHIHLQEVMAIGDTWKLDSAVAPLRPQFDRYQVRAMLTVRVGPEHAPLGTISLSSRKPHEWTESEINDLRLISHIVAGALEARNAQRALEHERQALAQRVAEQTAELTSANAALVQMMWTKDRFLANMSHELRTPLSVVVTSADLLHQGLYGALSSRQQRGLDPLRRGAQHLLTLIEDLLDLSRIESGRLPIDLDWCDAADLARVSAQFVRSLAFKKGVSLSTDVGVEPAMLQCDPRRVKQILINLLGNAVKFTPSGREVGIKVSQGADEVSFTVWDKGLGISLEDQARIFRPFEQLAQNPADAGGTGLGLALVSHLVALHSGRVSVRSAPGEGSTFVVTLPVRQAGFSETPVLAPATETTPRADPAGRLLIAEDNEDTRELLRELFTSFGWEVFEADDGEAAWALLPSVRPDVLLTDVHMPRLTGLDLTRRLRADPVWGALPVVIHTAVAMRGDEERCLGAGANAYFAKPVDLRRLESALRGLIRGANA